MLDYRDFKKWVGACKKDQPVGDANSITSCPIACYFKAKGYQASVSGIKIDLVKETRDSKKAVTVPEHIQFPTPAWAYNFINLIDSEGDLHIVSRAEAMRALQKAHEVTERGETIDLKWKNDQFKV